MEKSNALDKLLYESCTLQNVRILPGKCVFLVKMSLF